MKIGIIGAGLMGRYIAQKLSKKGHQVLISNSRGPHTIEFADNEGIKAVETAETVVDAEAVILTIPLGKVKDLPKNLFNQLGARIPVIETMNYFPGRDGVIEEIENGMTHSVWVQEQIGRPVVKTFSNIVGHSFEKFGSPKGTPGRIALTVSGDNQDWKDLTIQLVDDTGFDGYDAGTIAESWRQQPGSPAYCTDLTVEKLKVALSRADKEQTLMNRDISIEKVAALGEGYMTAVVTGNYPEDFDDPVINIYRSINGIPLK